MKGAQKADTAEAQHNSAGDGGGKHLELWELLFVLSNLHDKAVYTCDLKCFLLNVTWLCGSGDTVILDFFVKAMIFKQYCK